MREGDVALTALPQADGQLKNRPFALLRKMPPFGDFLVCGISTQLQLAVSNFDELVLVTDADFPESGLKAASLVRLGYLAVLPEKACSAELDDSLPSAISAFSSDFRSTWHSVREAITI